MTTQDNQHVRISVTMETQSGNGIHWQGTVEVTGPMDDSMVDQVVLLSDQLAARAFGQDANNDIGEYIDKGGLVEKAVAAAPNRPRRRRTNAQIEAEAVENQAAAQVDELDSMADELNYDVVSQLVKEGAGLMASALEHQKAEVGSMQTLGKPDAVSERSLHPLAKPSPETAMDDDDDDLPF